MFSKPGYLLQWALKPALTSAYTPDPVVYLRVDKSKQSFSTSSSDPAFPSPKLSLLWIRSSPQLFRWKWGLGSFSLSPRGYPAHISSLEAITFHTLQPEGLFMQKPGQKTPQHLWLHRLWPCLCLLAVFSSHWSHFCPVHCTFPSSSLECVSLFLVFVPCPSVGPCHSCVISGVTSKRPLC